MKKNTSFIIISILSILMLCSCVEVSEFIAYITIYNQGDLAILAEVEGSTATLEPEDYKTWEIELESSANNIIELSAELVEDSRYTATETISISQGEVFLWPIGWYSASNGFIRSGK